METSAQSQAARNTRMKPGLLKPKVPASSQETNREPIQLVASRPRLGSTLPPTPTRREHKHYCLGREWTAWGGSEVVTTHRHLGCEGVQTQNVRTRGSQRPLVHHRPLTNFLGFPHQKSCMMPDSTPQGNFSTALLPSLSQAPLV